MTPPFPGPLADVQAPPAIAAIEQETTALGFSMNSGHAIGRLLAALAASRPGGRLLELGTGTGYGTAWLLHGMTEDARLETVESEPAYLAAARRRLGDDSRVTWIEADGDAWLAARDETHCYDLVFADTWPGKFRLRDEALKLVRPGGLYVIDDLSPLDTWSADHAQSVSALLNDLGRRPDLMVLPLEIASGVAIAIRR
jgi:predicted O-methyltransferase YrrM